MKSQGFTKQLCITLQQPFNLIASFADEENKKFLHQSIETYQQAAAKFKQDAMQWPAIAEIELAANKTKLAALKEESRLLAEKGFEKNANEAQKQIIAILEFLIVNLPGESSSYEEELSQMRMSIAEFENQAELPKGGTGISELQTRALFYKGEFLLNPETFVQNLLTKASRPFARPLDGQAIKNGNTKESIPTINSLFPSMTGNISIPSTIQRRCLGNWMPCASPHNSSQIDEPTNRLFSFRGESNESSP